MTHKTTLWMRVSPASINAVLSSKYLDILEPLLDRPADDIPLKDDRSAKANIYKLITVPLLRKRKHRRELYNYLPREELRGICSELELSGKTDEQMRDALADLPWKRNAKTERLVEFLDVPDFFLDISESQIHPPAPAVVPWVCKHELFDLPIDADEIQRELSGRSPFKTLKSYQADAHHRAAEVLRRNFGRCILNMPTGTGKTRTAMEAVCSYMLEHPAHSVLWTAHTRELLDQAILEFSQLWEFLGDRPAPIVRREGRRMRKVTREPAFIVTSFQTLLQDEAAYDEAPLGLIVVDEAHMVVAEKWVRAIQHIVQKAVGTRILGLTATPLRTGRQETSKLVQFFQETLIQLDAPSGERMLDYLINQRILAKPVYHKLEGTSVRVSAGTARKLSDEYRDIPQEWLTKIATDGQRNLKIVQKLADMLNCEPPQPQILFFGSSVEHSKMIATWLTTNGHPAFHLDGTVDTHTRRSCIQAFRSGELRVLCNFGVLSTGFDAPKVDCVFIARPTTSHVLHSQMVGRGLRGPVLGGTSACHVVEVDDNFEQFAPGQKCSFEQYLELWE